MRRAPGVIYQLHQILRLPLLSSITLPYSTYPALRYSTLLYSTLLYPILLYSTLLYSTLLYSTLLYSTLLYSTLRYATLRYATLRYATLRYATLRYATLRYATLLYSTLLYSTLLYSTLFYLCSLLIYTPSSVRHQPRTNRSRYTQQSRCNSLHHLHTANEKHRRKFMRRVYLPHWVHHRQSSGGTKSYPKAGSILSPRDIQYGWVSHCVNETP